MSALDRRSFLQLCSAAAASLATPSGSAQSQSASPEPAPSVPGQYEAMPAPRVSRGHVNNRKNLVAIQVRGYAWIDEGVEPILENIQNKGDVNTVWAYTFGYGETRLRKDGPIPLPDHGKSGDTITGGAFYAYDPKYFHDTILEDFRSPDYGDFNVIEQAAPKAHARGMSFFAWDLNNAGPILNKVIPNYAEVSEIDVYGRRTNAACFNNPDYQAFLRGKVESLLLGYPSEVDGIAWGSERMGPLDYMIAGEGLAVCFCPFCQAKGRAQGISVERAQTGYRELTALFDTYKRDQRPDDGYFVTFLRMLLRYPEILAWETLWMDSFQGVQAQLYGMAKAIAPEKPFGFHLMQNMTFNPFYRAEEDYTRRRNYADFFKIACYNNAGGPRLAAYIEHMHRTIFHDVAPEQFMPFFYGIMGYQAAPFDQLASGGLPASYVAEETKRALDQCAGEVQIYPGIDINVPVLGNDKKSGDKQTSPEDVSHSIHAAFGAGAQGVVLSREYVEMYLANLTAAGNTLREVFAAEKS
ncbi:MAG TPA: twin-arginine translocation signal domain-containing protein [Acidobacteriaceae bacterium]|jgi:hypothetical protein|nr:twin-arginine translocation signal domain-containing protein [Acidobacteriaceae bacterium]